MLPGSRSGVVFEVDLASAAPKFPGGFGWLWFNLSEIPCEWGSNSSFDDPSSPHLFHLFG